MVFDYPNTKHSIRVLETSRNVENGQALKDLDPTKIGRRWPDRMRIRYRQWLDQLTGWRRGAVINTILTFVMFLVLCSIHAASWAQSGSLTGYEAIFTGECAGNIGRVSTALHLLINILSTLILASSNFFMQILSSPSRQEVDRAHEKGHWLDIGIPSPRNAFRLSRLKTSLWLLFLLSSIPVHVLFNSVIFSTDHRESDFNYYIVDESIATGGEIYFPGTSLNFPLPSPDYSREKIMVGTYNFTSAEVVYTSGQYAGRETVENMTQLLPDLLDDYRNSIRPNAAIADDEFAQAASAGNWERLDVNTCRSIYNGGTCTGLYKYRHVALVLDHDLGWTRSQVWNLPLSEALFWDEYLPDNKSNSLWQSGFGCSNTLEWNDAQTYLECQSNCTVFPTTSDTWEYDLFNNSDWRDGMFNMVSAPPEAEYLEMAFAVKYCLAEQNFTTCQIGFAKSLLIPVTGCVFLKLCLCIGVILILGNDKSLVTPGDAMESFITQPASYYAGSCLLDQSMSRSSVLLPTIDDLSHPGKSILRPLQWHSSLYRRWHAIPRRVWATSYAVFSLSIGLVIGFFVMSILGGLNGSFGQDASNSMIQFPNSWLPTFVQAILIANSAQLILSFAYLTYNNIFTRLQMAKEWATFGTTYTPLRVTEAKGQQNSTYFLQLPLKYSVPLLIVSILLHWVLSGAIYLVVMQGGYYSDLAEGGSGSPGPFDSTVALGYSSKSLLALMVLGITLASIPPLAAMPRISSNSIIVGSNSLAMAAACHVSPLMGKRLSSDYDPFEQPDDGVELRPLLNSSAGHVRDDPRDRKDGQWTDEKQRRAMLRKVSQSKLRWGVVKMPPEWAEGYARGGTSIGHISFGVAEEEVEDPVEGNWYA